jgi:hypothetical protein
MPKKFKDVSERIVLAGRAEINQDNLTDEKYEALVKDFPSLVDKFEDAPAVKTPIAKAKDEK